ncbi:glycosyltransferase [Cellulophaga lytica]|uniref:Glycosyl transferase group 1 n=1 Tax=Cellulophaga lytica (strain ATCC 23178 / DSM 7489 / JCM 8516 / NBRC 14961 / NCIMB 1423 / VKM B-1433 / Cy l20) TaxID=867900 RepID=F0R9V3_CELLC|nr:glycosyltransferase [Cellulophaga lytica]ADY30448.1 glycosyl transferase group 1 [Cellulophaga lytica DSM 7489]WQG78620.1 glycosyltransferase [Cellulophaga lytica]
MQKVLIIYNRIWPYRIPIFNLLSKEYDLTVSYSIDNSFDEDVDFKVVKFPGKKFLSRFYIHNDSLHKICENYDVVIGYGDIGWLSLVKLLFIKNKSYKLILWGIGVRASYKSSYGEKSIWDKVRFFLMKKTDAVLFYSKDPIPLYVKEGFKKDKLHVANNTVYVDEIDESIKRENLLFIGTLYKQKKIYELLDSYHIAYKKNKALPNLEIIGGGDEFDNITNWIKKENLSHKVFLRGKIFDEGILKKYFSSAIACISPGQAGLSVLKSMGYGVPYISKKNAITGGEIFNIENGVSGLLYENDDELQSIILDISENPDKYIEMGKKAKSFYDQHRKPEDMAKGISNSIKWVLNNE